jgi:hypothetical protein
MTTGNAPFFVDNEVITLTKNGIWIADGTEITHEPTRRLFARSLKKIDQGYQLEIGRETKRIHVEDTAYFVIRIDETQDGRLELLLSDETREILDPSTLNYRSGRLTCRIKNSQEEAKFIHAPYMDLLQSLKEDSQGYYLELKSKNEKIRVQLENKA